MLEDHPKKRIGIIALILFLVISIPGGMYLIHRPQIFSPKAQESPACTMFTHTFELLGSTPYFNLIPAPGNPIREIQITQTNVAYGFAVKRPEDQSELSFLYAGEQENQPRNFPIPANTVKIYINVNNTQGQNDYYTQATGWHRFDPDGVIKANIIDSCGTWQVVFSKNNLQVLARPQDLPAQPPQMSRAELLAPPVQSPPSLVANLPQASSAPVVPDIQRSQNDPSQQRILRRVTCLVGQISKVVDTQLVCVNRKAN
jgi:hypothetical protein